MEFAVPDDLRYLESHEWVRVEEGTDAAGAAEDGTDAARAAEDGTATVGISDFAQDELGDIVFVEFPEEGDTVTKDEAFGVIESIKAVSDLYAPVSGEVVARNETLFDDPELVNEEPFEGGWMLEIEMSDESELDDLLDAEEYTEQIE
jgi:glycine cleavage system H protein